MLISSSLSVRLIGACLKGVFSLLTAIDHSVASPIRLRQFKAWKRTGRDRALRITMNHLNSRERNMSVKTRITGGLWLCLLVASMWHAEVLAQGRSNGSEGNVADRVAALEQQVEALLELLEGVSREMVSDETNTDVTDGTERPTLIFSGMNLQIVNGTGTTSQSNGVGNLIVGYNEPRDENGESCPGDDGSRPNFYSVSNCNRRLGSHMLVVGSSNNYMGFGGIVSGLSNETGGSYSNVLSGSLNIANGFLSSVYGGSTNDATGIAAIVGAGSFHAASGTGSAIFGGATSTAIGDQATIVGGRRHVANSFRATILGGHENTIDGRYEVTIGGRELYCDDDEGNLEDEESLVCVERISAESAP